MSRNTYSDSTSWEESRRNRDARHRRINNVVNSMSEDYFRCLDCGKFCEDYDQSKEADVCMDCNQTPLQEETNNEE